MIKKSTILLLALTCSAVAIAKPSGNEWINYNQKYYKIPVSKNGIYRISQTVLNSAGIPISSIDPRNLQLFCNGVEQKIYVEGEGDGSFDTNDFIEFYGEKNTGKYEFQMYSNASFHPDPYYSLINDTAMYFLTWNSSTSNERMALETDNNFASYMPDSYFYQDKVLAFNSTYYAGETNSAGGSVAEYSPAEGYFDGVINLNQSKEKTVATPYVFTSGPNALIETVIVGASLDRSKWGSPPDHHILFEYKKGASSTYIPLKDTLFRGYEANKFTFYTSPNNLGLTETNFQLSSIFETGYTSNRTALSYIRVKYPHTFDLEGKSSFMMYLPDNVSQVKSYLNVSNFVNSGTIRLYNLTNGTRVSVSPNGASWRALIANTGQEKACYITSDGFISNVTTLIPAGTNGTFANFNNLATDSAFVIVYHRSLLASATAYKDYRSNDIYGGQHNVVMADIYELYDQFAYGIGRSPLSIKGFADYLIKNYPSKPQNLLLLGKGYYATTVRSSTTWYSRCLIPSFGNPASDVLLTAGVGTSVIEPAIPTGRIAAKTDTDVLTYLNKIKEYENVATNPPAEWKKHVLHFGGGKSDQEQNLLKYYLTNYKNTITDSLYGARVDVLLKTSSAPIQINSSQQVRTSIDNGISLMTFFGHASGSGFDQSIDDINSFNPLLGHYPFLLALGCYVGNIHTTGTSTSEEYTLTSKGVVGYLGSLNLGIPSALNFYADEWYRQLSLKSYGKSVGHIIQQTIKTITPTALNNELVRGTCFEMTLHGDPSIKINAEQKPDYTIANDDVSIDMTTYIDSVIVTIVRTNLGKGSADSIFTSITRTFPNGEVEEYLQWNKAPLFKDTITLTFAINSDKGLGINTIQVTLDALNEVAELNENNNSTTDISFTISGGGIAPVYPAEFAIIPKDTITLVASTFNAFEGAKNYIIQFDTIDTFDSPFMKSTTINAKGGVVTWKPPVTLMDSTVYYWRTSPDSINALGYIWKESSFQYITTKRGWEQAHFFQFKNNKYEYVEFNRLQQKFKFFNNLQTVAVHSGIWRVAPIPWQDVQSSINTALYETWHCNRVSPSITVVVIDPNTGNNLKSPTVANPGTEVNNGVYGECQCRTRERNTFDFLTGNNTQRQYLIDFLNNASVIPNGHYVLAYNITSSLNTMPVPSFGESFFQAFESIGSGQIRTIPSNVPFAIFGKKGDPIGSATEVVGDSSKVIIDLSANFNTNWTAGRISSPVIGSASSWDSFHWRQRTLDTSATNDSVLINIIGITSTGSEAVLASFARNTVDVLNLSTFIDAVTYPKIRLEAEMSDVITSTPSQLDRWQVIFEPAPEGAINPAAGFYISNDTLQVGEAITMHIPFQNISDIPFNDSLVFTYWVEDVNGVITLLPSILKNPPLLPGQVMIDTLVLNTNSYPGLRAIWAEVNPITHPNNQPEQYHFNNVMKVPVIIERDELNPLLDVTFDGIHILNNDIVSAKPSIVITLKDENLYLALNDTADFKVFIQSPSETFSHRVYFNEIMTFTPAVLPNNSCIINYTPTLLEDGNYQLTVQATDRSSNQSGMIDYKINFEVVNKSTITDVMNYPNPFTSSTRFVFTLTGSEIPTYFKIQIMNIKGKVVKEITQDELGPITIGRNISQYAWNGKDEYGDQLANGVYLYRVVTSINGQAIEKQQTEASKYFKNEFGKMYLMR